MQTSQSDQFLEGALAYGATQHQQDLIREAVAEIAKRKIESLRLYEPTEFQEKLHACRAKEAAIIAGNQVGKSLATFVELARAVTGQDPHGKYPEKDGVVVVIGLDEKHIGRTVHDYLFKTGRFKICRDPETQEWRTWHPSIDTEIPEEETVAAPPLIPERFVKNIAWEKRGLNVFSRVEFHNGWVLYAMSSKGEPAGGFQADLIIFDEDIDRPEWYGEMLARTSMRDGLIRWSALPLNKNDALCSLMERAESEEQHDEPKTVVIRATMFDNVFMTAKARDENVRILKQQGEDEYRKRVLGELVIDSILMYPTWSRYVHDACPRRDSDATEGIQRHLLKNAGTPDAEWCRYAVIDPGYNVCAVTFWAVPPPDEWGDFKICYDMLYMRNCTAKMFGDGMAVKCRDHHFQAFIIDAHGARIRDMSSGITPRQQYQAELEKRNIVSEETGSGFVSGSDNIKGRELKLQEWLYVTPEGHPTMYVVGFRCEKLAWEFGRFRKRVSNGVIQDDANRRGYCHAIETCEYAAAHGLPYVKPVQKRKMSTAQDRIMEARKQRERRRRTSIFTPHSGSNMHTLGPRGDS